MLNGSLMEQLNAYNLPSGEKSVLTVLRLDTSGDLTGSPVKVSLGKAGC